MNTPLKKDNLVYKNANIATETIHRLLCHVRKKGISWIPESFGIQDGKHVLSFIEGDVIEDTPDWLWDEELLRNIALKLRQWHDATEDFMLDNSVWLLENDEPNEVICHSDFAPYNIVFKNKSFQGLIDFDVCSPGSRLWDISYAVYRFIPLLPNECSNPLFETSPISKETIIDRLNVFLTAYSQNKSRYFYEIPDVIIKVKKRLKSLSHWSREYGLENNKKELIQHADMYMAHANWIESVLD
ncbi:phosphotransferase [Spirochaeta dissipatitropha]